MMTPDPNIVRCWSCSGIFDPAELTMRDIPKIVPEDMPTRQSICAVCSGRLNWSDKPRPGARSKPSIGEELIAARQRCGLTQVELGLSLGVSQQAIAKWESGDVYPRQKYWGVLEDLLGLSLTPAPGEELEQQIELTTEQALRALIDQALSCLKAADQLKGQERNNLIGSAKKVLECAR